MRSRLIVLVTVAALAAAVTLLGGAFRGSHSPAAQAASPAGAARALTDAAGLAKVARTECR